MHFVVPCASGNHGVNVLSLIRDEIHKYQAIVCIKCLFQGPLNISRFIDAHTYMPKAFSQPNKIRQCIHVGVGITGLVEEFLPLTDHAHVPII